MNRTLKLLCLAVGVMLMCTACGENSSREIAYRVSGNGVEITLLGSIHIGSRDMYPMGKTITDALEKADLVVFECDTQSAAAQAVTQEMMRYSEGEELSSHISAETYELLTQTLQKTGYPPEVFQQLKPWAAVSLLSVETTAAEMKAKNRREAMALGVEKQILKLAEGKPIRYLESAQEQLTVMEGFSPELQEYMLQSSCRIILDPESVTGMDATIDQWPQWWRDGLDEAFAQNYLTSLINDPQPVLMQEYHQKLLVERNQRMADRLCSMLENGEAEHCFVTVGLLHLVLPEESILTELERRGYTVEKIMD